MKKAFLLFISVLAFVQMNAQNGVAISNTAGDTPDGSAILDVKSANQGLLIPRVDIDDLSTAAPVSSPVTSLLVYNTNTTTGPGFFYWDSKWHSLASSQNPNTVSIDSLTDAKAYLTSVFIGQYSGHSATTNGTKNTGVGVSSLYSLTSGVENVAIGFEAGKTITTGNLNIMIGGDINGTEPSSATANRELNIGNTIYATDIYNTTAKVGIGNGNKAPKSTLDIGGSINVKYEVLSAATYTVQDDDYLIINVTIGGGTITLPDPATCVGRIYVIKNSHSTTLTVDTNGGLIDGNASVSLDQYKFIKVFSIGGSGWAIIGQN